MSLHEQGYFRNIEPSPGYPFNLAFHCPGCGCSHGINTDPSKNVVWQITFTDGKPTVTPSILVRHGRYPDPNDDLKYDEIRCHLFIRNGNIEYLSDCTHKLSGKTIPLEKEQ